MFHSPQLVMQEARKRFMSNKDHYEQKFTNLSETAAYQKEKRLGAQRKLIAKADKLIVMFPVCSSFFAI